MSAHLTIAETALIGSAVAIAAATLTYFATRKTIEAQRELTFARDMWLKRYDSYSDLAKILTRLKSEALSKPIKDVESRFNEYRDRLAIVRLVASSYVYKPCDDFANAISDILDSRRDVSAGELTSRSNEAFTRMSDHLRRTRGDLKYCKPPHQEKSQESN